MEDVVEIDVSASGYTHVYMKMDLVEYHKLCRSISCMIQCSEFTEDYMFIECEPSTAATYHDGIAWFYSR